MKKFRWSMAAAFALGAWCCSVSLAGPSQQKDYRLEPVWEVVDDGQQPFLFGILEDLLIDAEGNVFVLDSQLNNIKVFSADGLYLRTLGGPGEGPGEFRAVGSLVPMPDGSLGVVTKLLAKIHKIDPATGHSQGTFVGEGTEGPVAMIARAKYDRSLPTDCLLSVVSEIGNGIWSSRSYLALYRDPGDSSPIPPVTEIAEVGFLNGQDQEEEEYYWLWNPWTIDSLGRVVMAPYWGTYQLRYYNVDGTVLQDVSFPFQQRPRTESEKLRLLHLMWGGESPTEFGVDLQLSETEAVVRELYPRQSGDIWVRTNRAGEQNPAGVFLTLDVVSATGEMTGKVRILGAGDESLDRIFFSNRDRVLVIRGAEGFIRTARGNVQSDMVYDLKLLAYDLIEVK